MPTCLSVIEQALKVTLSQPRRFERLPFSRRTQTLLEDRLSLMGLSTLDRPRPITTVPRATRQAAGMKLVLMTGIRGSIWQTSFTGFRV